MDRACKNYKHDRAYVQHHEEGIGRPLNSSHPIVTSMRRYDALKNSLAFGFFLWYI